jgi:hypothetical protein
LFHFLYSSWNYLSECQQTFLPEHASTKWMIGEQRDIALLFFF